VSTRQVQFTYSGDFGCDIDEAAIVDELDADATDEQIVAGIDRDIAAFLEGGDVPAASYSVTYDRDRLIESVRREIARRQDESAEAKS
jgi:hypothetical protein